jgi:hypothetical protein
MVHIIQIKFKLNPISHGRFIYFISPPKATYLTLGHQKTAPPLSKSMGALPHRNQLYVEFSNWTLQ